VIDRDGVGQRMFLTPMSRVWPPVVLDFFYQWNLFRLDALYDTVSATCSVHWSGTSVIQLRVRRLNHRAVAAAWKTSDEITDICFLVIIAIISFVVNQFSKFWQTHYREIYTQPKLFRNCAAL